MKNKINKLLIILLILFLLVAQVSLLHMISLTKELMTKEEKITEMESYIEILEAGIKSEQSKQLE